MKLPSTPMNGHLKCFAAVFIVESSSKLVLIVRVLQFLIKFTTVGVLALGVYCIP